MTQLQRPSFDRKTELVFIQNGKGDSARCAVVVPIRFRTRNDPLINGELNSSSIFLSSNEGEELMIIWRPEAEPDIVNPIAEAQKRYVKSGSKELKFGQLIGALRIDDFSHVNRKIAKPTNVAAQLTSGRQMLIISYAGSRSIAEASSIVMRSLSSLRT